MFILIGVLYFLGIYVVFMNWAIVVHTLLTKKHVSLVPLIGGVFVAIAMYFTPYVSIHRLAWIPLISDIGCIPLLVFIPIGFYSQKRSR